SPLIAGAQVVGTIVDHGKGAKVKVLKFKRRKMHRKRTGHRQGFTSVKIDLIQSGGASESPAKKKATPRASKSAELKGSEKTVDKKAATAKQPTSTAKRAKPAVKKPASKSVKSTAKAKTAEEPTNKAEPESTSKKAQE
ncbi:MAG: 50S ribosomal protein L21, partial [bacterium]